MNKNIIGFRRKPHLRMKNGKWVVHWCYHQYRIRLDYKVWHFVSNNYKADGFTWGDNYDLWEKETNYGHNQQQRASRSCSIGL
jgi:hypothetical protein